MTQSSRTTLVVGAVTLLSLSAGCGGSQEITAKTPTSDNLPTAVEHEGCDFTSSSAQKLDTNGDGKPDIVRVAAGGRETCRMVDLNHDDRPDAYIYFDGAGQVRRRESDFDRDGRIDEVAYYNAGVVVRKDRETNLDGKLDTWDFYEGGKLHHRMRDSDADGKVDQWWTWPNPEKVECAVIASDHNNDGKPDPTNVIDVCAANAPTAAAPSAPVGASSATLAGAPLAAPDAGASVQAPPPASANSAFADAGAAKKTPAAKGKKEGQ